MTLRSAFLLLLSKRPPPGSSDANGELDFGVPDESSLLTLIMEDF